MITPGTVGRLVLEIFVDGVIDEPDLRDHVRPFMQAVQTAGVNQGGAQAPAIVELYAGARAAVDRLIAERARGVRAPGRSWSEAELKELSETIGSFWPRRRSCS